MSFQVLVLVDPAGGGSQGLQGAHATMSSRAAKQQRKDARYNANQNRQIGGEAANATAIEKQQKAEKKGAASKTKRAESGNGQGGGGGKGQGEGDGKPRIGPGQGALLSTSSRLTLKRWTAYAHL